MVALQKVSTTTERLLNTSKKHNEQIRCSCLISSTSLQSLLEPEIGCDSFVCHYPDIFTVIFGQYMHLFTAQILSEHQQDPQYASSGCRVKFCRQYKCFNLTPLHPHLGALCCWSFHIWLETSFMCRLSFSTPAPIPLSMSVLCYRSWDRLLTMIVEPFGAYKNTDISFKNAEEGLLDSSSRISFFKTKMILTI